MREIKFRAKRMDSLNNEWIYGSYMDSYFSSRFGLVTAIFLNDYEICKTFRIPVLKDTVGQFTGLKDKNGKEIYEGDIVEIDKDVAKTFGIYSKGIINYLNGGFIVTKNDGSYETIKSALFVLGDLNNIFRGKIIGNVWEDGDLLNDSQNTKTN